MLVPTTMQRREEERRKAKKERLEEEVEKKKEAAANAEEEERSINSYKWTGGLRVAADGMRRIKREINKNLLVLMHDKIYMELSSENL